VTAARQPSLSRQSRTINVSSGIEEAIPDATSQDQNDLSREKINHNILESPMIV
jgi:hypothetical protein